MLTRRPWEDGGNENRMQVLDRMEMYEYLDKRGKMGGFMMMISDKRKVRTWRLPDLRKAYTPYRVLRYASYILHGCLVHRGNHIR